MKPETILPESAPERAPRHASLGYASIEHMSDGGMRLAVLNSTKSAKREISQQLAPDDLLGRLKELAEEASVKKLVSVGTVGPEDRDLRQMFWGRGIVPMALDNQRLGETVDADPLAYCQTIKGEFTEHGTAKVKVDAKDGRVHTSKLAVLEDWKEATPQKEWEEGMALLGEAAKDLKGPIIRINTTAQAGGVAGMNHPALRFVEEYNHREEEKIRNGQEGNPIDLRWHTMNGHIDAKIAQKYGLDLENLDPKILEKYGNQDGSINVFKITKMFHNILQGVALPDDEVTDTELSIHAAWTETQAKRLEDVLKIPNATYWIDDQQPVGLIPYIQENNPDASILERLHIQVKDPSKLTPPQREQQRKVIDFLLGHMTNEDGTSRIDAFLAHRSRDAEMDEFLFKDQDGNVDARIADKVMYKVATADQVDGLGKPLTEEEREYYLDQANQYLEADGQKPIDLSVGHIGQFARMDRAKNYPGAIASYALFASKMLRDGKNIDEIPEQILCGFGAGDDPDGEAVLAENKKFIAEIDAQFPHLKIKDKIKILRLDYEKYSDKTMRALEEICDMGMQLSVAEGCEDKITQLIDIGMPVVVADVGGMPPQIVEGKSGYLVDPHDHDGISERLYTYFNLSEDERNEMKKTAKAHVNPEYMTIANVRDVVGISAMLQKDKNAIPEKVRVQREKYGRYPFVKEVVNAEYSAGMAEAEKPMRGDGQEHVVFQGA